MNFGAPRLFSQAYVHGSGGTATWMIRQYESNHTSKLVFLRLVLHDASRGQ
jgi:hypothetical protein